MFCKATSLLAFTLFAAASLSAQSKLSAKWEELTAPDFRQGIQQAKGTCLLPFGILEKHGPHLPLGTDLLNVRYAWQRRKLDIHGAKLCVRQVSQDERLVHCRVEVQDVAILCPLVQFRAALDQDAGSPFAADL